MIQQSHSWAYSQKRQTLVQKDTYTPVLIAALFSKSRDTEATELSINSE